MIWGLSLTLIAECRQPRKLFSYTCGSDQTPIETSAGAPWSNKMKIIGTRDCPLMRIVLIRLSSHQTHDTRKCHEHQPPLANARWVCFLHTIKFFWFSGSPQNTSIPVPLMVACQLPFFGPSSAATYAHPQIRVHLLTLCPNDAYSSTCTPESILLARGYFRTSLFCP